MNGSRSMQVKEFRVGYLPYPPFVLTGRRGKSLGGVLPSILNVLAEKLHFKTSWMLPVDMDFGNMFPNGTATGLYGNLVRNEIDIIAGPWVADIRRWKRTIPSSHYTASNAVILASSGKNAPGNFFAFIFTFDVKIWCGLLLAILVLVICSAYLDTLTNRTKTIKYSTRISTYFWIYLASFYSEGSNRKLPTRKSQLLLGIWLLCVLVMTNLFTGQFKALLMVQSDDDIMYTVKDLADRPHLIPFMPMGTIYAEVFQYSPIPEYQEVWKSSLRYAKKALLHPITFLSTKFIQKVKDGVGVAITEPAVTKTYVSKICHKLKGNRKLYIVDEKFFPHYFNLALSEKLDTKLVHEINKRIIWLAESHIVDLWFQNACLNYWKCIEVNQNQEDTAMGWHHLRSVFQLWAVLLALTTIIFILELLVNSFAKCHLLAYNLD